MRYLKRKTVLFSLIGLIVGNCCIFATPPKRVRLPDKYLISPIKLDLPVEPSIPEKLNSEKIKKEKFISPLFKSVLSIPKSFSCPMPSCKIPDFTTPKHKTENIDQTINKLTSRILERLDCDNPTYITNFTKQLLRHIYLNYELGKEAIVAGIIYWDRIDSDFLLKILKFEDDSYIYVLASLFCIADKCVGNDMYSPTSKFWAKICNIDKRKVIEYERYLCMYFDFNLYIHSQEYQIYEKALI